MIIFIFSFLLTIAMIRLAKPILYSSDCETNLVLDLTRQSTKNECLYMRADQADSLSFCDKIDIGGDSRYQRDACYRNTINASYYYMDSMACAETLEPDNCYLYFAKAKDDRTICNSIIKQQQKKKCDEINFRTIN